jgi:hypothetical protein
METLFFVTEQALDNMTEQHRRSWQHGFNDGKAGRLPHSLSALMLASIEEPSYIRGWVEGEAERRVSAWIKAGTAGVYLTSKFAPRPSDPP